MICLYNRAADYFFEKILIFKNIFVKKMVTLHDVAEIKNISDALITTKCHYL